MKRISSPTRIISHLLVISSFLTASTTVACQSVSSSSTPSNDSSKFASRPQQIDAVSAAIVASATTTLTTTTPTSTTPTSTTTTPTTTTRSQLRDQNLIGSILLRAASLNSLNRDLGIIEQQFVGQQDDHAELANADSQLLMPTDSGEDPLESTTIVTSPSTAAVEDHIRASLEPQSAPGPTGATSGDMDVGELESNNVSAIISETDRPLSWFAAAAPSTAPANISATARPPLTCEQAYTQCARRKACEPALKAYHDHCHKLISNQTNECAPKCLDAMIALRSSEEGDDLASCDCQSDDYCLASKSRGQLCKAQVDKALDPKTVVSCSTASWICMADQSCAPALSFYYRYCRSLLTQHHCSARCNNSLAVLYHQPKAHKLIRCQCDGSEEFPCLRLKANTEQLCLNKIAVSYPLRPQFEDNDDELTLEEESSNLTNHPENFVLGVPIDAHSVDTDADTVSGAANSDTDTDTDADTDSANKNTAKEESNFNGIQLPENSYIPLISGNYFTNAQHQQQPTPLGGQQTKQRHKQKEQKQQPARRSQRNMRQQRARSAANANAVNATHNQTRPSKFIRPYRILMFAASTSSSPSTGLDHLKWPSIVWTSVIALVLVGNTRNAVNFY